MSNHCVIMTGWGVFSPDYVDEKSGYRYYSFEQLQKIIAVQTCLDTGIVLSELDDYNDNDRTDYLRLINDALGNIDRRIAELERKKSYLNFLREEVDFNDRGDSLGESGEVYGSIALWIMPFEGDMETFSRKDEFLKLASEAAKNGYQVSPLYFGMMMKCTGNEKTLYTVAGLENFLYIDEQHPNIYYTPCAWYRRVTRPDLDVTDAETVFPDLFWKDYDKIILTTISLQSNSSEPMYSMYINIPE